MTKRPCRWSTLLTAWCTRNNLASRRALQILCVLVFCAIPAISASAQVTFTTLVTFDGTDGKWPNLMNLAQGADGNLYGTTSFGGDVCTGFSGCGTIFKVSPSGALTTLYEFCPQTGCIDGSVPLGTLVQASNGDFYGVTTSGGSSSQCNGGCGTIFKIGPAGKFTTLYNFCTLANCSDGDEPFAGLAQGGNGNFYGTTALGGLNNEGTIFEITPTGTLTTLYSFCALATCADGEEPSAGLVQGRNGEFYGEASAGGTSGCGTIFKITPKGPLTTLFSFDFTHGCGPMGGLIQAASGDFYGVTVTGGSGFNCEIDGNCGTVFKMSPEGTLTTLYNFCASDCTDGAEPFGPLVQGTDGNFYGTTYGYPSSGPANVGTIFKITPKGILTTLFTLGGAHGNQPAGGLLQSTNGTFYGTTLGGGSGNNGTVFSLSTGLGPFVKTQPASAREGAKIVIFGQGFDHSSVVKFGGVQATNVKVSGSTYLFATVPASALTGPVAVTATTLISNQPFRVKPQVVSFDPPSGSVGTQVTIAGVGFMQTNGVGFGDNVPAQFTVNSDTEITAMVPAGAKTGPIGVVTKGGTTISSSTFTLN